MNFKNTNFLESLKAMKPRDFVYPSITLVFLIVVTVVFFVSTQSITNNINKAFQDD